jgi:hypothetical protein
MPHRTIVKAPYFEFQLKNIHSNPVRADEFIEAAEWVLSRKPNYGFQVSPHVWFVPLTDADVAANLYYTFDDKEIHFIAIELAT